MASHPRGFSGPRRAASLRRRTDLGTSGGSVGASKPAGRASGPNPLEAYLADCRALVVEQIEDIVASGDDGPLRGLIMDYPLRPAKALRPAICIATCRALGGHLDAVAPSAAVLELFHNAFLVHDDVEDGSELRRGGPTLHREHGVPIAVNVGDAMFALSLQPLLDNTERIGLGAALEVLQIVATMCRHSVEGQALELDWIRRNRWDLAEDDYMHMVEKKTGWYTFIAPVKVGAVIAGAEPSTGERLVEFAQALGRSFQIQDDLLNLQDGDGYGKEADGDLYEGKRTLILLFALEAADEAERQRALRILGLPREDKTAAQVSFLRDLIQRTGGDRRARDHAEEQAIAAARGLESLAPVMGPSRHLDFLRALVDYVHTRSR